MNVLNGKTALITGGSAGIGLASAQLLAREGADIAINYNSQSETAESFAREVRAGDRQVLLLPGDVANQTEVEEMIRQILSEWGHLDILVANAAYSDEGLFYETEMDGFRRTIDVTMWGTFYCLRAAARQMMAQGTGGTVVIISSVHAVQAIPRSMAYNMAKAAIDQMARTAALELAPAGIRVNILYPGWTDTPGERKYFTEEQLRQGAAALPLGRLARPDEIARGVLFLVDPRSDYITGATLAIDGGTQLPWWSKRGSGEL